MRLDFGRAFGFGIVVLVVLALLVTPLAQFFGFEGRGIGGVAGRMIGFGLFGAATLLVVQAPALWVLGLWLPACWRSRRLWR